MSDKPYLLLDIDGTLNASGGANYGYVKVPYDAETNQWAWMHLDHGAWLAALAARVDIVWATSWHVDPDALAWYAAVQGLPTDLPVIEVGQVSGVRWGHTLKFNAVGRFLNDNRRPAIWLDDIFGGKDWGWAEDRTDDGVPTLLVQANPFTGWTADQYAEMTTWLGEL